MDVNLTDDSTMLGGPPAPTTVSIRRRRRLAIAVVAAVLGLVALVAGWIGTSGTRVISDQLAYIASGGMLGLFLIGLAAAVLLADFMIEQEQSNAELRERLWRIEASLAGGGRFFDGPSEMPLGNDDDELVVVPGAERVHRASCPLVHGKPGIRSIPPREAADAGLRPCRTCSPQLAGAVSG